MEDRRTFFKSHFFAFCVDAVLVGSQLSREGEQAEPRINFFDSENTYSVHVDKFWQNFRYFQLKTIIDLLEKRKTIIILIFCIGILRTNIAISRSR